MFSPSILCALEFLTSYESLPVTADYHSGENPSHLIPVFEVCLALLPGFYALMTDMGLIRYDPRPFQANALNGNAVSIFAKNALLRQ